MKLNAKAACTWLAVPLVAIVIAACGDDGSTTPAEGPCDGGAEAPCGPLPGTEEYAELHPECGDTFVTESAGEECEDGPSCNTETCKENICGDGFVGPGEDCDQEDDCNDCRDPECGDGAMDQGEECDDGNANNTDDCSNSCNSAACGDGIVQSPEECDEGADNGANGSCTDECADNVCGDGVKGPGEACDDGNEANDDDCTNACGLPTCGDGVEQAGEECDDNNTSDRDECLSSCVLNVCGDGIVLAGTEECDDGNSSNADSCTNGCVSNVCGDGFVGPGETCDEGEENADDGECSTSCGPTSCGDEVVQAGEECDDGNTNDADGCTNNCLEAGCGDGIRQDPEECDDGNTSNADACANTCLNAFCGDGNEGPGEACDDGNNVDGDGCQAGCETPTCGDGIVDADEECDDENTVNTDDCLDTCLLNVCGDGAALDGVEDCDDGNTVDTDICTNECENAGCGDGIVGPGEGCDDGNATDGDGCNDDPASAVADCTPTDCGNGVVDPGELCDDGNTTNTDACLNTCAPASCGDNFVQTGVEGCDDANASNADACLNTCVPASCGDGFLQIGTEACDLGALNGPGSQCSTSCTVSNCGDGELDAGEDCDDANNNNNDSCLSNCIWNECGDGAVYVQVTDSDNPNALEECDDDNAVESDLCLVTCDYNRCSDGVLLTDNESEPYDDPDGTGIKTASRGGLNDVYHSGGDTPNNLTSPFLLGPGGFGDNCDPGQACVPGLLDMGSGIVPTGSGLSAVDIDDIDVEECDDDNLVNTDACLARNEDSDPEYECRVAYCNDGEVLAGTEQCDDGCGPLVDEEECAALRDQNDSCLDTCVTNVCGDGWLYTTNTSGSATPPLEACDDGNTAGGDSCLANCSLPTCGNGVLDFSMDANGVLRLEECDLGSTNADTGTAACSTTCRLTNASNPAVLDYTCGNGTINAGEECDDGGLTEGDNNDSCLTNCQFNACGDGARYIVQSETNGPINPNRLEQCDDANDNNGDSCLDTCRWNSCGDAAEYRAETDGPNTNGLLGGQCDDDDDGDITESNSIPLYNDCNAPDTQSDVPSEALIPEECDDGNTVNNDTCSNSCEDSECGDGILQAGEICDDGDTDSEDDCLSLDADVDVEDYCDDWCGVAVAGTEDECLANCEAVAQSCTLNACGDGFQSEFEACDDGNNVDTDECHNNCSLSSCGNNLTDGDEECEDGNSNSNDACTNLCLFARCGDGILQIVNGEECDDGNDINTDACTSACKLPECGDGVRQGAEQCDPGRGDGDFAGNEQLNTGTFLYANHNNTSAPDPTLSDEDRDDGFIDEPFFCNPNTCQIRCNATVDTLGRRWKENNEWCVFAAEPPGQLNDASDEGFDGAWGSYTIYNETTGEYDPEEEQYGWDAAREHCQSYGIGADLVVIRNTTDNDQFLAMVNEGDDDYYWWLALNDTGTQVQEPNGVWRWLDGTPTDTFRNWSGPPDDPQRPDDSSSDEDCGGFAPDSVGDEEGTWNDLVCQSDDVYVACEFRIPAAAP